MLEKLQIKPGERIALISENCPEFVRAIIEIWESNAVAIPVNTSYPHLKLTAVSYTHLTLPTIYPV